MDLCIVNNDPIRTLLVTADGPRYEISTPENTLAAPTTIVRIESEVSTGHVVTEIGKVEHHELRGTRLQLCATNIELSLQPLDTTESENSWAFIGPDNRPYKWQVFIQSLILILNDNSNTLLARYRRAKIGIVSRSRKAFLEILPAGLGTVDFIVVTFVSFMKQRIAIRYHQSD